MIENLDPIPASYLMARFNVSRATAYRMLRRLAAVRVGQGKYIVSLRLIEALSLRAIAGRIAQVSTHPGHAAPHHSRGVGPSALDSGPGSSPRKNKKGKRGDSLVNQEVISQPVDNKNE